MKKIRFINWNISYQGQVKQKIDLIKKFINEAKESEMACIVALQEVTNGAYLDIISENIFHDFCYSLNYRKPGPLEGRSRGLGCFIGCSEGLNITEAGLLERAPFPERALKAKIKHGDNLFEIICFHSLTGVGYLRAKSAQFMVLADYLSANISIPTVLCGDFNEPKIDHVDQGKLEFFDQKGDQGKAASYILNPQGIHNLQDSYRLWLEQNEKELQRIKREQETSEDLLSFPLAVSHLVGGKVKKRYDYILISPDWEVVDLQYLYEEAVQHGSDHAVVLAHFYFPIQ